MHLFSFHTKLIFFSSAIFARTSLLHLRSFQPLSLYIWLAMHFQEFEVNYLKVEGRTYIESH